MSLDRNAVAGDEPLCSSVTLCGSAVSQCVTPVDLGSPRCMLCVWLRTHSSGHRRALSPRHRTHTLSLSLARSASDQTAAPHRTARHDTRPKANHTRVSHASNAGQAAERARQGAHATSPDADADACMRMLHDTAGARRRCSLVGVAARVCDRWRCESERWECEPARGSVRARADSHQRLFRGAVGSGLDLPRGRGPSSAGFVRRRGAHDGRRRSNRPATAGRVDPADSIDRRRSPSGLDTARHVRCIRRIGRRNCSPQPRHALSACSAEIQHGVLASSQHLVRVWRTTVLHLLG